MDRKQRRDQTLNLAEFKIDDILSVPGDRLLAEVAEDYGHPTHLADAFDTIASPVLSRHDSGAVGQDVAPANISLPHPAPGAASLALASRPLPAAWSVRTALATLAGWLVTPRRRVALGACVALLLVAVLAPGIYPRLVDRSGDRIASPSADQIAPPTKDESTPLPAPTSPEPQPAPNQSGSRAADLSSAVSPTPSPAPPPPATQPTEARRAAPPAATASRAEAPRAMAAAEAPGAAPAQSPLRRPAAAKAPGDGSSFVVQIAAAKSEAQARATFRDLRSRYAVLRGREPVIRRKEAGNGASYAVQVGPFQSQGEAEELCGNLKVAGGTCFTTKY
jgi:cell division septation protein DedD